MTLLIESLTGLFSLAAVSLLGFQFIEFLHAALDLLAQYRNHS
ncbi:hypothetical protein [Alteribacter natronophilus]|nr:hypothetical protein [Alteribacter natronophilus]